MIKNECIYLGQRNSRLSFYLPNAPILPPNSQILDSRRSNLQDACINQSTSPRLNYIEALIDLNGNHWRKILNIMAKLSAPDNDWRGYRDQLFTGTREQLIINQTQAISCISNTLAVLPSSNRQHPWHIVCGQQSAHALGLEPVASKTYKQVNANIILAPYLDYRQFPNQLVDEIRAIIHDE